MISNRLADAAERGIMAELLSGVTPLSAEAAILSEPALVAATPVADAWWKKGRSILSAQIYP